MPCIRILKEKARLEAHIVLPLAKERKVKETAIERLHSSKVSAHQLC